MSSEIEGNRSARQPKEESPPTKMSKWQAA